MVLCANMWSLTDVWPCVKFDHRAKATPLAITVQCVKLPGKDLKVWIHYSCHKVPYCLDKYFWGCVSIFLPRTEVICSADWSNRWGRPRPGSDSRWRSWPKLWSDWTQPEPRPAAGTSGCSGCTHSFPPTVGTGVVTNNLRERVRPKVYLYVCVCCTITRRIRLYKLLASKDALGSRQRNRNCSETAE